MIPSPTEILLQYMVSRARTQPEQCEALAGNLEELAYLFEVDEEWFVNPAFNSINQAISNIIARQMKILDRVYIMQASHGIADQLDEEELTNYLTELADAIFEDGVISWSRFAAMNSFLVEICNLFLVQNDPSEVFVIVDWWDNYMWKPIQDGVCINNWIYSNNIWHGLVNQGAHQVHCLPIVNPNVEVPTIPDYYTPFQNMPGDV